MNWMKFGKWFTIIWITSFFIWLLYCLNQFSIIDTIKSLPIYWPLYLSASLISYLFATLAWRFFDVNREFNQIGLINLFFIRQAGESLGQINPLGVVGGDVIKDRLIKKVNGRIVDTISSIYLLRIHSILSFLVILILLGCFLIYKQYGLTNKNFLIFGFCIIILFLCIIQGFKYLIDFLLKSISIIQLRYPKPIFSEIENSLKKLKSVSRNLFLNKKSFLGHLCLIIHWLVGGFEVFLIVQMLNIDISVVNAYMIDYGVMVIKSFGQVIPAQVGLEELSNKFLLENVLKLGPSTWLTFSLLRRFRQIIWILVSFIYLFFIKYIYAKNEGTFSVS